MRHLRAGGRAGERHHAGITEQIQYLDRPIGSADMVLGEAPVDRMFLEHAHMAEGRAPRREGETVPAHRPFLGGAGREDFPLAAAFLVAGLAGENGVGLPAVQRPGRFPEGLRVGADHGLAAEAFQLHQVPAVEQRVIVPVVGDQELCFCNHW